MNLAELMERCSDPWMVTPNEVALALVAVAEAAEAANTYWMKRHDPLCPCPDCKLTSALLNLNNVLGGDTDG